jgi:hypothetical protein
MANSICFIDNFPEASAVTVNETNLQFNGANADWYEERFVQADLTDSTTLTLANYPVSSGSISLFLNSGAQRQTVDYTVSGNMIVMTNAITASDIIMVRYFAYTATVELGTVPVGSVLWQASAVAPAGYNFANGLASYVISDYAALYTYCTANSLVLSETATNFVIVDLGMTVGAIALKAIIKN